MNWPLSHYWLLQGVLLEQFLLQKYNRSTSSESVYSEAKQANAVVTCGGWLFHVVSSHKLISCRTKYHTFQALTDPSVLLAFLEPPTTNEKKPLSCFADSCFIVGSEKKNTFPVRLLCNKIQPTFSKLKHIYFGMFSFVIS